MQKGDDIEICFLPHLITTSHIALLLNRHELHAWKYQFCLTKAKLHFLMDDLAESLTTLGEGATIAEKRGDYDVKVLVVLSPGPVVKVAIITHTGAHPYLVGILDSWWTILIDALKLGPGHVLPSEIISVHGYRADPQHHAEFRTAVTGSFSSKL